MSISALNQSSRSWPNLRPFPSNISYALRVIACGHLVNPIHQILDRSYCDGFFLSSLYCNECCHDNFLTFLE